MTKTTSHCGPVLGMTHVFERVIQRTITGTIFARDSAYMLSPVRPSVRLSHGWISQKRLKLGSCNFHHHDASFLTVNFTPKFKGELRELGRQIREG